MSNAFFLTDTRQRPAFNAFTRRSSIATSDSPEVGPAKLVGSRMRAMANTIALCDGRGRCWMSQPRCQRQTRVHAILLESGDIGANQSCVGLHEYTCIHTPGSANRPLRLALQLGRRPLPSASAPARETTVREVGATYIEINACKRISITKTALSLTAANRTTQCRIKVRAPLGYTEVRIF